MVKEMTEGEILAVDYDDPINKVARELDHVSVRVLEGLQSYSCMVPGSNEGRVRP